MIPNGTKLILLSSFLYLALGLGGLTIPAQTAAAEANTPGELRKLEILLRSAARRHFLDPLFVKAVVWQESRFNPDARGKAGEVGLMQITRMAATDWADAHRREIPATAEMLRPELNLDIGCWYLARALKYWKSHQYAEVLALCEYNAGRSRAERWKSGRYSGPVKIDIASTKSYVINVLLKYYEYVEKSSGVASAR